MSLIGALNIGSSALAVQQAALQTTGNNIANSGDPNYTRQVARSSPSPDQQIRPGLFVGTGVTLTSVQRQVDDALDERLRNSTSDAEAADTTQQWLGRVESIFNELGDDDLSTRMSTFFNSWSSLANSPQDAGLRQVVLQNGQDLTSWIQTIDGDLSNLQSNADQSMASLASNADQLASQVAQLNGQIVTTEAGAGGSANALRDQRDAVLANLSKLINVTTTHQSNGTVNVYVGSEPLIIGTTSRGVAFEQQTVNGKLTSSVVFKADNSTMKLDGSGQLGALSKVRDGDLGDTINQLNDFSKNFIFEFNKIYSSGQGLQGFDSVSATNVVTDPAAVLNDPAAGLAFTPQNGSFVVHVTDKATGLQTSTLVKVDLDGLNGNDTTLNDLAAQLNAVPNLSATINGGKLSIQAASPAVSFGFSQDSSGVLAALGVNTFLSGTGSTDIAVNATVQNQPSLINAAQNGDPTDNQTATAIAAMQTQPIAALGGISLTDKYQSIIDSLAVSANTAKTNADATQTVQQTLANQRQALSGVSTDEEAVNMMKQQRAFQGAAKLISTVDEMMQTLLQIG
jgi:flagellar hook-associated protein 1 FlgK